MKLEVELSGYTTLLARFVCMDFAQVNDPSSGIKKYMQVLCMECTYA